MENLGNTKLNKMNKYELIDKVVAEIAKDKGISEDEVGTYETLLRVADIAVKNCSIHDVSVPKGTVCEHPKPWKNTPWGYKVCPKCNDIVEREQTAH